MTLQLYQIIVAALSAFMIYQGVRKFFQGKDRQTFLKFFVRIIVWGGMATVALFPGVTNVIAEFIGLQGNINAVILTGFLLVFLMIFKLLSAIERLEQQMSEVVRYDAIQELQKKKYDRTKE